MNTQYSARRLGTPAMTCEENYSAAADRYSDLLRRSESNYRFAEVGQAQPAAARPVIVKQLLSAAHAFAALLLS